MMDPNKDEDDEEKTGVKSLHRSSSANRKPNHTQNEGSTIADHHERPSRTIRSSNTGSLTNQSSASTGHKHPSDNIGARPKEFRYNIAQSQSTKKENSGYGNRSQDIPKKRPRHTRERLSCRQNIARVNDVQKTEIDTHSKKDSGENSKNKSELLTQIKKNGKNKPNNANKAHSKQTKEKENRPKDMRNKEEFGSKMNHAKVTHLNVVLKEEIPHSNDTKAYLMQRMGNPKAPTFKLDSRSKVGKNKCNIFTMIFESYNKARIARNMLMQNNKNFTSKLKCFFTRPLADCHMVEKSEEKKTKLELALRRIDETAISVCKKHEAKIEEMITKVSFVENERRKVGLSLYILEQYSNEQAALEDKLKQYEKQLKEFRIFMDGMKLKMEKLKGCDKFEKDLDEVQREFGIEYRRIEAGLPVYACREDILTLVKENQVCVILGETGSGKSTQIAQYIYQAGFAANGLIACTQPRKIAAINLAIHVASEMESAVGQTVGYKAGVQYKTTSKTKLLFMTDQILLNECLNDGNLTKYSCVIIDEANERSIYTDLLLGMLKKALTQRPDLKVIITSAIIDPDIFVDYFCEIAICPVMKLLGRPFHVDVFWEEDNYFSGSFPDDYESKAISKAIKIHQKEDFNAGDILVFLTSIFETERCSEILQNKLGDSVYCLQLHENLAADEQQLVFNETPRGKRKIVFATSSAETSVTISGIKFVVDTGVVKEMRFDPKTNMNTLDVVPISQTSANQRKRRAGRTDKGFCYRLYSQSDFKGMTKISSPEILRIQVSQALLKLMEFGVDPLNFDYIQPPSSEAMKSAISELNNIGAAKSSVITDLGKLIAKLPVEPKLGVFIKRGIDMGITSEAIVVASCCNQTGIFFQVGFQEQKEASDLKKMKFCHPGGDLITMLRAYREWDKINKETKGRWCQNNSINSKTMEMIQDTTNEIITSIKMNLGLQIKHAFKDPDEAEELIQKLILEYMSSNLGYFLGHETCCYLIGNSFQKVKIHPSSAVLSLGMEHRWVIFNRVLKTSSDYMTEITPVSEVMITDAVQTGTLCLDIESLKSQTIQCVLKVPIGRHVLWKYVSRMQKERKQIEEKISAACDDSLVIAEANKLRGEIMLFCSPTYKSTASAILLSCVDSIRQQLLNESMEEFIGFVNSGVRALLHVGGSAINILMPDEFRSLNIKEKENVWYDLYAETLKDTFERYGPIEEIRRFDGEKQNSSPFWGTVTFTHEVDAVAVVDDINEDTENDFTVVPITFQTLKSSSSDCFTMKVTWCRRPTIGYCFIKCERPEDTVTLLNRTLRINGNKLKVQRARGRSDLYIKGLSHDDATVKDVKAAIARELNLTFDVVQQRLNVILPRQNADFEEYEWQDKEAALCDLVSKYVSRTQFRVTVLKYSENTVIVRAFVEFSDADVYYHTTQQMSDDDLEIDGHKLHIALDCKTNIHVTGTLYNMVADDIHALIKKYRRRNSTTTYELQWLKSGNWLLHINAVSPRKLIMAKVRAEKIIVGDVLECGLTENPLALSCRNGERFIRSIEQRTQTWIVIDERQMKVIVLGCEQSRFQAIQEIKEFIAKRKSIVKMEEFIANRKSIVEKEVCRFVEAKQNKWLLLGEVTFTYEFDAVKAVDDITEDTENDFTSVPITFQTLKSSSSDCFTMKVTWCRRPTIGYCFIKCERPEDTVTLLNRTLRINGNKRKVRRVEGRSELYIKGLSHNALVKDVKAAIARKLNLTFDVVQQRLNVILPRQNADFEEYEWQDKEAALYDLVSKYVSRTQFRVTVLKYSENTVIVRAFVHFSGAEVYYDTAQQMSDDDLEIDGHKLHIALYCKTNVHVTGRLYNMVADDIDALIERYRLKNSSTTLELQWLKSGNWLLQINAESPNKLIMAKVRADKIIGGDVLECGLKESLHALFCSGGKVFIESIEQRTETLIVIDERQMKVTVQGRMQNRVHAIQKIEEFIAKRKSFVKKEICLKGEENPPGLLKALLVKYGIQFGKLKNETGISGIKLNLRRHEITLTGTEETVKQASDKIKELREGISKTDTASTTEMNINDCPICLCPVEENDMYRLEYCGHAYCRICVATQLQSAVADRKMPVVCEVEDCKKPFVIKDINTQLKLGNIKKKEFVDAAVSCLVTERSDAFRYCITPNCEVVYRTTTKGSRFHCPVCHARICTSCHVEFHDGLTCDVYKNAKQWVIGKMNDGNTKVKEKVSL